MLNGKSVETNASLNLFKTKRAHECVSFTVSVLLSLVQ